MYGETSRCSVRGGHGDRYITRNEEGGAKCLRGTLGMEGLPERCEVLQIHSKGDMANLSSNVRRDIP